MESGAEATEKARGAMAMVQVVNSDEPEMDGTLSSDEFKSSFAYMIDAWASHCPHVPQWRWFHSGDSLQTGEGYLVLEDWPFEPSHGTDEILSSARSDDGMDEGIDGAATDLATVHASGYGDQFYTYHIVYNEMYRVPKLFVKGRCHDGRPIEWHDLLRNLPAGLSNDSAKWTFLTYEEHPYLHMPWLALHPCGTSELMKMFFSTSIVGPNSDAQSDSDGHGLNNVRAPSITDLYGLTWLSFVGQAVALKMPREFSKCFVWTHKHSTGIPEILLNPYPKSLPNNPIESLNIPL